MKKVEKSSFFGKFRGFFLIKSRKRRVIEWMLIGQRCNPMLYPILKRYQYEGQVWEI